MTSDRIKEIQSETAYPDSISVYVALLKVWNECSTYYKQPNKPSINYDKIGYTYADLLKETGERVFYNGKDITEFLINHSKK